MKGVVIMNNNEYLNEERYKKNNKRIKIFYLILSLVGISMVIGGIILLVINKSVNYFSMEKLMGCMLILVGVALSVLSVGDMLRHSFTRDIVSYYVQQQMPIVKEGIEKISPTMGVAAKEITNGIKEGLKEQNRK